MRGTLVRLTAVVIFAAVALVGWAPSVGADQIVDAEAQATAIATKLDQLNGQLTLLSAQVADAQHAVVLAATATAKGRKSLAAARTLLVRRRVALSSFAVDAYVNGGSTPMGVLDDFDGERSRATVRDGFVHAVGDHRQQVIDAATAAARAVADQAERLARAEQAARASADQLTTAQDAANQALTAQNALQKKITAKLLALINEQENTGDGEADAMDSATAMASLTSALETKLPPAPNPVAALAVATALSEVGKPYVWGGAGPDSFDCSGLTMWSYAHAGVSLAHWTGDQVNQGQPIDMKDLQPGDLIFMWPPGTVGGPPEHVTMYIGNNLIVQAPHVGSFVEISSIYWWAGAARQAVRIPVTGRQAAFAITQPVPTLPVPNPPVPTTVPGH
jgi:peptidoglycan DL-endopeptidase CwlO